MPTYNLERVFTPRSVALVGGSPRAGSLGATVLANLRQGGFPGELGVVNWRALGFSVKPDTIDAEICDASLSLR